MQDMLMKIFIVDILLEGGQNNNKKIMNYKISCIRFSFFVVIIMLSKTTFIILDKLIALGYWHVFLHPT